MMNIIEAPRSACGQNSSQNAESALSCAIHHSPRAEHGQADRQHHAQIQHAAKPPATGREEHRRPVTNIVSPICRLS